MNLEVGAHSISSRIIQPPASIDILTHAGLDAIFLPAPRSGVPSAWYGHVPFAYWIMAALRPRMFVELGTHNGVSYAAFCDAAARAGLDTRCFAIDTWQGDQHAGMYGEEVYNDLCAFHDVKYGAFSELLRATFDQALAYFEDGSIDLLHIDGCHSYEAVRHDFESWRPKLSPRAVVLFHDTNVRERDFGVWRLWSELQSYPSFEFLHGHGLGVLAFGSEVPDAILKLCNLADAHDITRIRSRFAFSGRSCIVESDVIQLRERIAAAERGSAEAERLITEFREAGEKARLEAQYLAAELSDAEELANEKSKCLGAQLNEARGETERLSAQLTEAQKQARMEVQHLRAGLNETRASTLAETEGLRAKLADALSASRQEIETFQQSTTWRITLPARALAERLPLPLRRATVHALKAVWWAVTPQRIPARLRARRRSVKHEEPLFAGLSGDLIPALGGDYTAAGLWYDASKPEVSIIVLNWNRRDLTFRCLQYLWERTTGHRYEVIVVDNGSNQEEVEFLRRNASRARIIPLLANRYFGEANNIGVEAARGEYICFLNNDAFVHKGWLAPLVRHLRTDARVGAVGPRFVYPDGRLQEAGAFVSPDGSVVQLGKGQAGKDPQFASVRQVDYISAACLLVRRSEFLKVLGFDLVWDPAYYEDVDLCLKLRLIGLTTFYCPQSTVTHIENATSSDASHGLELHNIVAINRAKFVARWEPFLRTAGADKPKLIPSSPAEPVATGKGRPRVVIFTPYNITPGGGERYILTIAEAFRDIADVTLLTPNPFSRIRILTMGRELGLALDHIDLLCVAQLNEQPRFDLAFVVGNEIFPSVGPMAAKNIFICQFPFPIEDNIYMNRVRQFWKGYDLVLTYSSFVRNHVLRIAESLTLPPMPIEILAPPVPQLCDGGAKHPQILHVGRFFAGGHCKRQDVMIEAFRTLLASGVKAELHLVGSVHPEAEHRAYYRRLVESALGLPVYFHANCSAEMLKKLYTESQVYWHATGLGHDIDREPHKAEHFGISVIEAMSAGCIPVVFAAGGPSDVVEDGVTGFHFRTVDELCDRTQELLEKTSKEELAALSKAAAAAAQSYGESIFGANVKKLAARFIAI